MIIEYFLDLIWQDVKLLIGFLEWTYWREPFGNVKKKCIYVLMKNKKPFMYPPANIVSLIAYLLKDRK